MSSDDVSLRPGLRSLRAALAGLTIVVFFGSLLALVIAWILDPTFLANTDKVRQFLGAFIPGTVVAGVVMRHLKRRLRENRWNISAALTSWLAHEPLLLALIWVFVAVELAALSFFVPIYALRVEVVAPAMNWDNVRVAAHPPNAPLVQRGRSADRVFYRTSTAGYRWGDSVVVSVDAGTGFAEHRAAVRWGAFALLEAFSGYAIGPIELRRDRARLTIHLTPSTATVSIRQDGLEQVVRGPQVLQVPRGTLELVVTAEGYQQYHELMSIERDTTLSVALRRKPGRITFVARDAIGGVIPDLGVFVDGQRLGMVGEPLSLSAGRHAVRLDICRTNGQRLVVDEFSIRVVAGKSDSIVRVARGEDCRP